jgi:hypothetical protein
MPLRVISHIVSWCVLAIAARRSQMCPCEHFGDVMRVIQQGGPESLV